MRKSVLKFASMHAFCFTAALATLDRSGPIDRFVWPIPALANRTAENTFCASGFAIEVVAPSAPSKALIEKAASRFTAAYPVKQVTNHTKVLINLVPDIPLCETAACLSPPHDESYEMSVTKEGITITAKAISGAYHALTTLGQLTFALPDKYEVIPAVINDKPRFPYRGLMLDTSRNYFPTGDILRVLDGMAASKLNVFHWHIIDSHSFPLDWEHDGHILPLKGAYRYKNGTLKLYTRQDVATIVQYAFERGITVVPEFDMPGHSTVWGNAYPEIISCANRVHWDGEDPLTGKSVANWTERFCAQPPCGQFNPHSEKTYEILNKFIEDMKSWFPAAYYHVGYDEVNKKCWNVTDASPLIAKFQARTVPKGKTPIYWDEVITEYKLSNLDKQNSVVQVWRHEKEVNENVKLVTSKGYKVITSANGAYYLDCGPQATWCAPFKDWKMIYNYEPTANLTKEEAALVMGGTGALWSETIKRNALDPFLWPRMSVIAEKLWSPEDKTKSIESAAPRLELMRTRLRENIGIDASALDYDGKLPQLYRPEWCDFNLETPAQLGNASYFPGDKSGNYCNPARFYNTEQLQPTFVGVRKP